MVIISVDGRGNAPALPRPEGTTMDLVERDATLRQLHDCLRNVAGGSGHTALVAGEAGIGKTSLLRALASQRSDVALWWGGCDALQTPNPLAPLYDIARSTETGLGEALAAAGDRFALFEAVLAALARSRRTVLLVVEDVHWADAATLDLLKFLGRRIEHVPCLLAISFRDDEVGAAHPLRRLMGELPAGAVTRIELPRLTPAGVETLARRALRSAEGIYPATRGNPFFVTELLRHGGDGMPHGVQDLVLSRFARLSRGAQDVVRLASIVPAKIEPWLVQELLAPDAATLEECLDSGLLLATGDALVFRHEIARAAVESALPAPAARGLHARVLAALEHAEARLQVPLARLAHHAARAGDAEAVLRLAPRAADEARRRSAHKEAAEHLRNALTHADALPDARRAELLDWLSYEDYLTGMIEEAIEARESALALWRATGDLRKAGDAMRSLSRLHWFHGGQTAAARDHARNAITTLEALPPGRELAMAYSNLSQLHMLAMETGPSLHWGNKALALALAVRDRETQIHALNNIGTAKLDAGDEQAGRADLERSLALAQEGGFEEHAARAFTNLGYTAGTTGHHGDAHAILAHGIAWCEQRDLDSWAHYMAAYRSEVSLWQGDWTDAEARAETVLRIPGLAPISRIIVLVVLGRLHARRGDARAQTLLDEALELAMPTRELNRTGWVAAARAEWAWLRGDVAAIRAEVEPGWMVDVEADIGSWIFGELGWWLQKAGALDKAPSFCALPYALQIDGHWREAAAAWAARGCPYERARALAEGDVPAQREALALFEQLDAPIDAERLRKSLQAAGVRGVPRGRRASTRAHPFGLTTREAEVLRLLCEGLSNAEIAARLHRSVRTIDHHLAAILAKIGVASRTEAVAATLRFEK
ncbi:MAG TPA: AAA family ATPase [Rhodanobacteraceae bacterium]|nr:AAA family ATPase [Rhodanobacteraceae bacterium]